MSRPVNIRRTEGRNAFHPRPAAQTTFPSPLVSQVPEIAFLTFLNLRNTFISRLCTDLHVNKIFFLATLKTPFASYPQPMYRNIHCVHETPIVPHFFALYRQTKFFFFPCCYIVPACAGSTTSLLWELNQKMKP